MYYACMNDSHTCTLTYVHATCTHIITHIIIITSEYLPKQLPL